MSKTDPLSDFMFQLVSNLIQFSIEESRFRLVKRNAPLVLNTGKKHCISSKQEDGICNRTAPLTEDVQHQTVCCLSGVIARVRVVFRKTVVCD